MRTGYPLNTIAVLGGSEASCTQPRCCKAHDGQHRTFKAVTRIGPELFVHQRHRMKLGVGADRKLAVWMVLRSECVCMYVWPYIRCR